MTYGDLKDLSRRTTFAKVLRDGARMISKSEFFDRNTGDAKTHTGTRISAITKNYKGTRHTHLFNITVVMLILQMCC